MNPRPHLPREIIGQAAECLDPATDQTDFLNLALASKLCRDESQRVLFRNVDMSHCKEEAAIGRECLFLDAIISAPERLGVYVRSYTSIGHAVAPFDTIIHSEDSLKQNHQGFFVRLYLTEGMYLWNKMVEALPHMTALRQLTLYIAPLYLDDDLFHHRRYSTNAVSILDHCHAQLESFIWGDSRDCAALYASRFFDRQPRLRTFGFCHHEEGARQTLRVADLMPIKMPRLEYMEGSTNALLPLLSRNTVQTISLTLSRDEKPSASLGRMLARTRHLRISSTQGFDQISPYLVSLDVLCFTSYSNNWTEDLSEIGSLTSLRILVVQDHHRDYVNESDEMNHWWRITVASIATLALNKCPSLQVVYVENNARLSLFYPVFRVDNGTEWGEAEFWDEYSEMYRVFQTYMPWDFARFRGPLTFL